MVSFGERLRGERARLGLSQTDFGCLAGVTKKTQMLYEAGERAPDAKYLAAVAEAGVDVLYVVTGERANATTLSHLPSDEPTPIDADRLVRIVEMLETTAKQAGRRWPVKKLIAVAAEVYNALGQDSALEEPQVERILKLVVNR